MFTCLRLCHGLFVGQTLKSLRATARKDKLDKNNPWPSAWRFWIWPTDTQLDPTNQTASSEQIFFFCSIPNRTCTVRTEAGFILNRFTWALEAPSLPRTAASVLSWFHLNLDAPEIKRDGEQGFALLIIGRADKDEVAECLQKQIFVSFMGQIFKRLQAPPELIICLCCLHELRSSETQTSSSLRLKLVKTPHYYSVCTCDPLPSHYAGAPLHLTNCLGCKT